MRTTFRRLLALSTALLLVPTVAAAAPATGGSSATPPAAVSSGVRPGGVALVRFVDGTDARAEAASLARLGAEVSHVYGAVFPGLAARLPDRALTALARNPRVVSIEADGPVRASTAGVQSDPVWGLDRVDQALRPLDRSYAYPTTAAGVRAYVVDTGIRADHVDLGGRVVAGYTAISDGRGTTDCNGHGTHVAGTVGGATYGVAKSVALVPVRVLDCEGSGTWSGVVAGLDWIVATHPAGTPGVVNMSLGGGANSTVDSAVSRVGSAGLAVVVAAGNSGADACLSSPARVASALTVGATSSTDARASWSNFGTCLDLFAPGVSITSAWHTSSTATASISGTSMAAPHAAGAVALRLALDATLSGAAAIAAVVGEATPGVVVDRGTGSPDLLLRVIGTTVPVVPVTPGIAALDVVQGGGRWASATATVTVVDAEAPTTRLAGVEVSARWSLNGAPQGSVVGTTASDGTVRFSSPTYRVTGGTVTLCVSRLAGAGVVTTTYSPAACGPTVVDEPTSPPADEPTSPPADEPVAEPSDLRIVSASVSKVRGSSSVTLTWTGADGPFHVVRDGVRITSSPVSGTSYTDAIGKGGGSFTYRVCLAADPSVCSSEVLVTV